MALDFAARLRRPAGDPARTGATAWRRRCRRTGRRPQRRQLPPRVAGSRRTPWKRPACKVRRLPGHRRRPGHHRHGGGRAPRGHGPRRRRCRHPRAAATRRLLVLDIDGVLIDADRSFMEAVARALAELRPPCPGRTAPTGPSSGWAASTTTSASPPGRWPWPKHGDQDLQPVSRPPPDAASRSWKPASRPWSPAQAVVQHHYADTIHLERPLVDAARAARPGLGAGDPHRAARRRNWSWPGACSGFRLPAVADAAPHLRKPEPAGLLQLADAFRAEEIALRGRHPDDARLPARGRRSCRPDLRLALRGRGARPRPLRRDRGPPVPPPCATCCPSLNQELP